MSSVATGGLQGSWSAHQSGGKDDDAAQQAEHAVDRNAHEPKWNQEDPHERVDDECQESQRPAEHQQDAPKQELHHTSKYDPWAK